MTVLLNHLYIIATIFLGVYSQLIMRWQVSLAGGLPVETLAKLQFVCRLLINPWVMSAMVATLLGGISWMLAMTKFETSYAYPFISLNFILVLGLSVLLFNESFSTMKLIGTLFIIVGIVFLSRS